MDDDQIEVVERFKYLDSGNKIIKWQLYKIQTVHRIQNWNGQYKNARYGRFSRDMGIPKHETKCARW